MALRLSFDVYDVCILFLAQQTTMPAVHAATWLSPTSSDLISSAAVNAHRKVKHRSTPIGTSAAGSSNSAINSSSSARSSSMYSGGSGWYV